MRRFGPIREMNPDDARTIVAAICGGMLVVPPSQPQKGMPTTGVRTAYITKPRYGQPADEVSEVMWEETYELGDYTVDGACRDAVMAAIDLAGDEVVYEPNGDDVIDWRDGEEEGLSISEQQIQMSSVVFAVNLKKDGQVMHFVSAVAKQVVPGGGWEWSCHEIGLSGRGGTMVQAVSNANDTIRSWWLSSAQYILGIMTAAGDVEQDAADEE